MSEVSEAPEVPTRLLGQLVDAVDDVLYVIDEGGEMVYWNDQLEEATGYTTAEIAAIDPAELMAPEDREYTPGLGGRSSNWVTGASRWPSGRKMARTSPTSSAGRRSNTRRRASSTASASHGT